MPGTEQRTSLTLLQVVWLASSVLKSILFYMKYGQVKTLGTIETTRQTHWSGWLVTENIKGKPCMELEDVGCPIKMYC